VASKSEMDEVDRVFAEYRERRIPAKHRDKVRLEYSRRGQLVTRAERHPPFMRNGIGVVFRSRISVVTLRASGASIVPTATLGGMPTGACVRRAISRLCLLKSNRDPTGILWG
jgi:hypothetical protein